MRGLFDGFQKGHTNPIKKVVEKASLDGLTRVAVAALAIGVKKRSNLQLYSIDLRFEFESIANRIN